jgi:hypothetical protein
MPSSSSSLLFSIINITISLNCINICDVNVLHSIMHHNDYNDDDDDDDDDDHGKNGRLKIILITMMMITMLLIEIFDVTITCIFQLLVINFSRHIYFYVFYFLILFSCLISFLLL